MILKHIDPLDSLRLQRNGVYEPRETRIVRRALHAGDVFVDVGAHIGYYSLIAAERVGPKGQVFAFEPAPALYAILCANIADARASQVVAVNAAVSCFKGQDVLRLNPLNTGDNRLVGDDAPADWPAEIVKLIRLDDLGLPTPTFIKIDTQGHEYDVLTGAEKTIAGAANLKMLVEYFPIGLDQNKTKPSLLLMTLKRMGFQTIWPPQESIDLCTIKNGRHCNLYLAKGS